MVATQHEGVRGGEEGTWHSWDPHPWRHPWLTPENLRAAKAWSQRFLARERAVLDEVDPRELRIAFCGNIANAMYNRAKPLRRQGCRIALYIHPQDQYVMSQPGWEEFDGVLPSDATLMPDILAEGRVVLPEVPDVHQPPQVTDWRAECQGVRPAWLREKDIERYEPYLCVMPILRRLQDEDVLWCTQYPYFGYLSGRPYVASQSGGDLWLETSRADLHGRLARASFGAARVLLASNPWSYAHARRLGYRRMIYLPRILDSEDYAPGRGRSRAAWAAASGGEFFVLTTSRMDERNKGSSIGFEGFARFAARVPGARLVVTGWGRDRERLLEGAARMGIGDRIVHLPVSGKKRLVDYLRSADAFLDQFVLGYFGSAGLEALACGTPVIGRIERAQYEALCETGAPPVLDCAGAAEVARALEHLWSDSGYRRGVGAASRRWFLDNHGPERWSRDYLAVLAATARGDTPELEGSPLDTPLSPEEVAYHAEGLAAAPRGTDYGW